MGSDSWVAKSCLVQVTRCLMDSRAAAGDAARLSASEEATRGESLDTTELSTELSSERESARASGAERPALVQVLGTPSTMYHGTIDTHTVLLQ